MTKPAIELCRSDIFHSFLASWIFHKTFKKGNQRLCKQIISCQPKTQSITVFHNICCRIPDRIRRKVSGISRKYINPFLANTHILYLLKTPENLRSQLWNFRSAFCNAVRNTEHKILRTSFFRRPHKRIFLGNSYASCKKYLLLN